MFNVGRWAADSVPDCCCVVPILYKGPFCTKEIEYQLCTLKFQGSQAVPGFMDPEGIIIFHCAGQMAFKATIGDDGGKSDPNRN